jgi:hypothetical protein
VRVTGDNVQVIPRGDDSTDKSTVPLKPFLDIIVIVEVPFTLGLTITVFGIAVIVKLGLGIIIVTSPE